MVVGHAWGELQVHMHMPCDFSLMITVQNCHQVMYLTL